MGPARHVEMPAGDGQDRSLTAPVSMYPTIRSHWEPSACAGATRLSRDRPGWPLHHTPTALSQCPTGGPVSSRSGASSRRCRRSFDERVGFVGRRFFGTASACFTSRHEPLVGGLSVLRLASPVAGHHANHAVRVESRRELRSKPLALLVGDGDRSRQIPQQLDARRRGVDVLAARRRRRASPCIEAPTGNRDAQTSLSVAKGYPFLPPVADASSRRRRRSASL